MSVCSDGSACRHLLLPFSAMRDTAARLERAGTDARRLLAEAQEREAGRIRDSLASLNAKLSRDSATAARRRSAEVERQRLLAIARAVGSEDMKDRARARKITIGMSAELVRLARRKHLRP